MCANATPRRRSRLLRHFVVVVGAVAAVGATALLDAPGAAAAAHNAKLPDVECPEFKPFPCNNRYARVIIRNDTNVWLTFRSADPQDPTGLWNAKGVGLGLITDIHVPPKESTTVGWRSVVPGRRSGFHGRFEYTNGKNVAEVDVSITEPNVSEESYSCKVKGTRAACSATSYRSSYSDYGVRIWEKF